MICGFLHSTRRPNTQEIRILADLNTQRAPCSQFIIQRLLETDKNMKTFRPRKFATDFHGLVLAVFLLVTSCATTHRPAAVSMPKSESFEVAKRLSNDDEIEQRLRAEYRRWKGTRHRLGGTGSRGIDCSGFVRAVYKNIFNIHLPRTTKAQVKQGRPIPFKDLQAGDLVFFNPPTYPRHVGIFLSASEFVHASKNNGVTLSKIDKIYWGKYYWTARRILPPSVHR
jgi:cell wall-associated NlpC family hydrolase